MAARRAPPWSPTAGQEEVRAYLQERLRLYASIVFWIFVILMAVTWVLYYTNVETRFEWAMLSDIFPFTGLAILGGSWWVMGRRQFSVRVLYFLDAICAINVGIGFGLSAVVRHESPIQVYGAFIWLSFMIFSRALIIPSTVRRTTVLSALAFVPLLSVAIVHAVYWPQHIPVFGRYEFLLVTYLSSFTAIVIAVTGSRVIYGLRQKVFEAAQLGAYTIEDKIGEGGMGKVYRARHAILLRPTAIKVLQPGRHGVDDIARFEREVQNMSRLKHPNTVAVYDYGHGLGGTFYYVMELLDGLDLERLVRREGAQPAPRVIRILNQICGALDEAHRAGLTHGDVKPGNVFLCRLGTVPDVAKVLDFGLVRDPRDQASTELIAGTPAYMAPEAMIEPERVGPASDLYSLGAVAYYLLTGHRVFDGGSFEKLTVQHATETPVPPSERTTNPIPPDLEALVMACLAKDPKKRPASAVVMRLALQRMPEAADWSEDEAMRWWDEFDRKRATMPAATTEELPATITIDLASRTPTSSPRPT